MNFEKLLRALLANVYKMPTGEIDSLLTESETNDEETVKSTLLDKDRARVSELQKPKTGQTFQDGYKKAKAEVLTTFENDLRERFEISDESLTGIELIESVITTKAGANKAADKLTEDDIRRLPAFQKIDREFKKTLKDKETEFSDKLTQVETKFTKEQTFSKVTDKILEQLNGMNPIFPTDPKVAATWKKNFLNDFKEFDFEIQDGQIVAMKDGKVLQDGHGHTLEFEALVKEKAPNYFEFKNNNGGGNGNGNAGDTGNNNNNNGGGANYPAGIAKPKTFEELTKIVNDTSMKSEDRQTVLKVWESEQSGQ